MWFIILLAVVIGLVVVVKSRNKKKIIAEAKAFAAKIKSEKSIPVISTKMFLEKGEVAYLEEGANMLETRAVRESSGGFGGVRIAKGITVGRYSGTAESHQEWRKIDSGRLLVTNKRLIFDGQNGNKIIPISKILNVATGTKNIQISIEDKTKDVGFDVKNGYIWSVVLGVLRQTGGGNLDGVKLDFEF